ncbi:hypothetical protein B6U84_01580 [Candidatus Bathyarchaeota archaeon ex4484_40]|nr:MAG: hypothetical protein B6U84_01580 [Candidatus Bathyarchaeota archaeon ex4484_40]
MVLKQERKKDDYNRLLNRVVELVISDGVVIRGRLIDSSKYSLTLLDGQDVVVVNKAFIILVRGGIE